VPLIFSWPSEGNFSRPPRSYSGDEDEARVERSIVRQFSQRGLEGAGGIEQIHLVTHSMGGRGPQRQGCSCLAPSEANSGRFSITLFWLRLTYTRRNFARFLPSFSQAFLAAFSLYASERDRSSWLLHVVSTKIGQGQAMTGTNIVVAEGMDTIDVDERRSSSTNIAALLWKSLVHHGKPKSFSGIFMNLLCRTSHPGSDMDCTRGPLGNLMYWMFPTLTIIF